MQQYYDHAFCLSSVRIYVRFCVMKVLNVDVRSYIAWVFWE